MKSKHVFTNYDLLDYEKASKKAAIYLNNMLNRYCKDKDCAWMIADRIKSLDSINEKIREKRLKKGKDFNFRLDVLDIAGLRVVFCDKNYVCPCMEELDNNIHMWSPENFLYAFEESKLHPANYDVENLYGFVEFLMRECECVDIVKDYVMYQKPSGYQSLHVIITVPVQSYKGLIKEIPVEIQFRNYTQHLYNELEHDVRYKKVQRNAEDYSDAFNTAKRFLLTVANDTYTNMLKDNADSENSADNKSYFLVRKK